MIKKLFLPVTLILLAVALSASPAFKTIAAGVAIFLFGMLFLEEGFRAFTGGVLESILNRTTDKLWKSLSFGVISTTIMQSSSLVSVVTISFLSAGLINLVQGIGIIFGSNIGTTTGAWLVAGFGLKVNISAYAMPMLVFGIILVFNSSKNLNGIGKVLAGLGFLFLGIHYMKTGFESFNESIDLAAYSMTGLKGLIVYTLIGSIATVVMQSSHATLVLIITALAAGQITYENALAVAIGANIGTTVTAVLGAMGSNVEGRRLAGAHFVFNMVTGAIAIIFITQIGDLVDWIALHSGIAEDNYTLKLAIFHTVFNTVGVLVNLPFVHYLERILVRLMPSRERRAQLEMPTEAPDRRQKVSRAHYLNKAALEYPDTALSVLIKEVYALYDNVFEVIAHSIFLHRHDIVSDTPLSEQIDKPPADDMVTDVDTLYANHVRGIFADILEFTTRMESIIGQGQLKQVFALRNCCRKLVDAVKDSKHLQKNLSRYLLSDDTFALEEYNRIRLLIASNLAAITNLDPETPPEEFLLTIDTLRLDLERNFNDKDQRIDEGMRSGRLSPDVAISILNDNGYAYDICQNLIDSAEILSRARTSGIEDLTHNLALDQDEMAGLIQQ